MDTFNLGEVAASEQLIQDLYLDLRRRTRRWAAITKQTAQARMGYIGQHLVSVVTGCPGGRSGARGLDLIHHDGSAGEIKTCYRVDQLGKCNSCESGVAPDEDACAACGSTEIQRKNDSKWLIGLRNEAEFEELLDPSVYYFVLFEYVDFKDPEDIFVSIWTVDPKSPGFLLCMIDYYQNIRSKSKSKAPFNLWPHRLKFELMKPQLIYRSVIAADDSIRTEVFPGRDPALAHPLSQLADHARAQVPPKAWLGVAESMGAYKVSTPKKAIEHLQSLRQAGRVTDADLCDALAVAYYGPGIDRAAVPAKLRPHVDAALGIAARTGT